MGVYSTLLMKQIRTYQGLSHKNEDTRINIAVENAYRVVPMLKNVL